MKGKYFYGSKVMEVISFLHKNIWAFRRGKEMCSISLGAFGAEQAQIPSFALVPFLLRLTKQFFLKRFCHLRFLG